MLPSWKREPEQMEVEDEASKTLLSSDTISDDWQPRREVKRGICPHILIITTIILICDVLVMWVALQYRGFLNLDDFCLRRTSHYSQLMRDSSISYHTVAFNGSLMKENAFRLPAGPEVDAAWETLGVNYRSVRVDPDEALKSGIALDQVKINQKYGGGYPANVEGLHQLHCLNIVRQALYWNYDYYHALGQGAFKNDDNILQKHITHCLDIVRQQLMCTVDIGVLGQIWIDPEQPEAFVDFNTEHKCRDYEAIRSWAEANQLPADVPSDFLQPPEPGDRIYAVIP